MEKEKENRNFGRRQTQYFCCPWFQTNHKIKVSWENWGSEGLDTPRCCGQPEDGRCAGLPPGRSSRPGDYSRAPVVSPPRIHQSTRNKYSYNGSSVVFLQTEKRLGQQNINSETTQRCGGKSMYSSLVVIWKYFLLKEPCSVLLTTAWCRGNRTFSVMNLIIKYVQIFISNCTQKSY